jgi:hypothetical protein
MIPRFRTIRSVVKRQATTKEPITTEKYRTDEETVLVYYFAKARIHGTEDVRDRQVS